MSPRAAGGARVFLFASLGGGRRDNSMQGDEWAQAERAPASQRLCTRLSPSLADYRRVGA
eukprot:7865095-Pyramimonas_sp.AAC.1